MKERSRRTSSLTIGQLAAHVGVTVRAIRHYHARGLLPEPTRDASGYRRYGAQAVVDLVRIRTLAEAGVPLAGISALLAAPPSDFADALHGIDRALGNQIRELQRRRRRLAQLTGGDHLFLSQEVVIILDELRALGVSERTIAVERDGWILVTALSPELIPGLAAEKARQLTDPEFRRLYLACDQAYNWSPDDPRLDDLVALMGEWARRQRAPETTGNGDDAGYLSMQLMTAHVAAMVPAWQRLKDNGLAHDRSLADQPAALSPPYPGRYASGGIGRSLQPKSATPASRPGGG
ncbi:MAG: MerR family transcriptional regulator [Candidatus Dormibacteria bacterium]